MESRNPYAAPRANVTKGDDPEAYGEVKVFSVGGRLGRARYLGYSFGMSLLILLLAGVGVALAGDTPAALILGAAGYAAIVVVQFMLTIQRAHDMNSSGWLSLILLIPLAGFVFWIVPGSKGENRFGLRPPPNSIGVILLACILPFLFVAGMLGAIALPAYQDYATRAQVTEGLNLASGVRAAVADAFVRTRSAPGDRSDAGLSPAATDSAGRYVEAVDVDRGTIFVFYGASANAALANRVLALQPYVFGDDEVVWRCAAGSAPSGAIAMDDYAPDSALETDIDPRFLPSACRP